MTERLQKFLARAGVASRRSAETMIQQGRVTVNEVKVTALGSKVEPHDKVAVDGKPVTVSEARHWYLLNKPFGVVTTLTDPQGRPTVKDFIKHLPYRLFPVGRLDYDAEGALLLTDDGEVANRLLHPRYEVDRTYLVKVKSEPAEATLNRLRDGVRLEDGFAQPAAVEFFEKAETNTWLKLVVREGRPHFVKRLCAAIGHPVVRLYRPFQAGVSVDKLEPGEVRALSEEEVERVGRVSRGEPFQVESISRPPRRRGSVEGDAK